MKKTITFGIPCYNSSEYMDHCIESILEGSDYADDVQIVIVDDGSVKDDTAAKADAWQERYPNIIKAVHQENGGHGIAVMKAVSHADGVIENEAQSVSIRPGVMGFSHPLPGVESWQQHRYIHPLPCYRHRLHPRSHP